MISEMNSNKIDTIKMSTKISHSDDKIMSLVRESKAKNKFVEDMTERLQETIRDRDNTQHTKNVYLKQVESLKSKISILEGELCNYL